MLEPFLDPAVGRFKGKISFGDLSSAYREKEEHNCGIAINVIRTAVQKPAVLPSLESEWRRGSVAPSRPGRDNRYRERENGRAGIESSTRASNVQLESSSTNSSLGNIPTVVLSGSRPFSGQLPTILQSRDRLDDAGSGYEENLDGSKDSGDTGSAGDPDSLSAFDGQPGGFGSGQRHSRGSKSRQLVERRERDGRHEGRRERDGRHEGRRERKH